MNEHPVFIDPRQGEKDHLEDVQNQNRIKPVDWEADAEYWYRLRNEVPPEKRQDEARKSALVV